MTDTKEAVLRELKKSGRIPVSGAKLAQTLMLSRASVWKAVEELRREGWQIDAATNRGYTLNGNRFLSTEAMAPFLITASDAEKLYVYREIDSTNNQAKKLALDGAPDGTVVFAETQTGGRGRRGRSFFSPAETGIYASFLIRSALAANQAVMITTAASVAVARAIDAVCGCHAQIKWINDIYLEGKKICGILTDGATNMENGTFEFIVVGVGINVNTTQEAFPEELRERAGSIYSVLQTKTDRNRLAAELVNQFRKIRSELPSGAYLEEYRSRSCVLGKPVLIFGAGYEGRSAVAESIDENGFLTAVDADGTKILLNSGEITLRPGR